MSVRILTGDAREVLSGMADGSAHSVVTSPPYWALRQYGGGEKMIGMEATFDEHLENLVTVFREVRRVLRPDGTLWLNYGDAYAGSPPGNKGTQEERYRSSNLAGIGSKRYRDTLDQGVSTRGNTHRGSGVKAKDLLMMPARVALALQSDGWWLRSKIIWHKPNPMPESVTDRPTNAYEELFLFAARPRYFYDAEAVRLPLAAASIAQYAKPYEPGEGKDYDGEGAPDGRQAKAEMTKAGLPTGANLRNVWSITTASFKEAHFATFPPALVEPCIKAGTSEKGVCPECGAPWVRVGEKRLVPGPKAAKTGVVDERDHMADPNDSASNRQKDGHIPGHRNEFTTTGWAQSCDCAPHEPLPATVLDPFGGAGTVGLVADRLQRDAVLIEINPEYAEIARRRIHGDAPLLAQMAG